MKPDRGIPGTGLNDLKGERFDVRLEPLLHHGWTFPSHAHGSRKTDLLLTGPNAFIGVFVLKELLDQWPGEIHCLLRADSREHAMERIQEAASRWKLAPLELDAVHFHLGHCTLPSWGLPPDEVEELYSGIGTVLHFALTARYDIPYAYYQRTWLPELVRMIDFCADPDNPKSLHYPGSYNSHFLVEPSDFERLDTTAWHSGYTGFKWVTEIILRRAFSGNLPGSYYDIPLVFGTLESGISPPQYSARHIVDIFLDAGVGIEFEFRIMTVDILAKIITCNVLQDLNGRALNYIRPVFREAISYPDFAGCVKGRYTTRIGTWQDLIQATENTVKTTFLLPRDFTRIIKQAHDLPPILPPGMDTHGFPNAIEAFKKNLMTWLMQREEKSQKAPGKAAASRSVASPSLPRD